MPSSVHGSDGHSNGKGECTRFKFVHFLPILCVDLIALSALKPEDTQ